MEREEILRLAIGVAYRVVRTIATETPPQGDLRELCGALGVDEGQVPRARDDRARNHEPGSEEYVDWSERFCIALSRQPEAVKLARRFVESWDRRNAASIGPPTALPSSNRDGPSETELVGTTAHRIGKTALSRGELSDAEFWLRVAVKANNARALNELAVALAQLGREREAQMLWMQADKAGDRNAPGNVAMICERRRKFDEAELWWRKAEERGQPEAAVWLGLRLYHRGEQLEAEARWRAGVQVGLNAARELLGALTAEQNAMETARQLLWDPAESGRPAAMWNLARVCAAVGEPARSLGWARRAAASGLHVAVKFLNGRTRAERDPSNGHVFSSSGPNIILEEFGRQVRMINATYVPTSCTDGLEVQTRSAKFEDGFWRPAPRAKRRWWLFGAYRRDVDPIL